jgi:hypothetical protein
MPGMPTCLGAALWALSSVGLAEGLGPGSSTVDRDRRHKAIMAPARPCSTAPSQQRSFGSPSMVFPVDSSSVNFCTATLCTIFKQESKAYCRLFRCFAIQ